MDESETYIKRVIGLPGETLEIRDAKVYINHSDTPLDEPYLKENWVAMNDGLTYEIPEECYFVMGDNRNDSKDSRFEEVGNIHRDELEGKAVFRIWPLSKFGKVK